MKDVIAVVLGGGRGTRLFPLTRHRSKPAVPLAGNYRLIDVAISNSLNSGIDRIYVLTQFNSASLNQHISRTYRFDAFSEGFVEILAAEQTPDSHDWFQGTADAVRKALPHLGTSPCRDVLVLSGDHLYRMDYGTFVTHHREAGADITIAVKPVSASRAGEFGVLKADRRGCITEFREKPSGKELREMRTDTRTLGLAATVARRRPYLVSMGVYLFRFEVLRDMLRGESGSIDFAKEIIPDSLSHGRVHAFLYDGYWEDIGTIGSFYRAHMDLVSPLPKFNLFDASFPLYTHPRFLPGSKVNQGEIERSILNDGCIIDRAVIRGSIIGLRSRIGAGTVIEDSLVMGADYFHPVRRCGESLPPVGIGPDCRIKRAIIDKNAFIGRSVSLVNRRRLKNYDDSEGRFFIRDGILVVAQGAVIEDGTEI
ncbi:MAG: glucose-1-phosphate adenylyltransferase [bacterium]|nr:MAG: glucose-1-phosphate adenylyltransferase [bacterium]